MSLRVEVAIRVTMLDGTTLIAEATHSEVVQHHSEDDFTKEFTGAAARLNEVIEDSRSSIDQQFAKLLGLADEESA
jgi:hypothetical protein